MRKMLFWGIVIGLVIGVMANPLMPPAFFILGGLALWLVHASKGKPSNPQQSETRG